MPAKAAVAKTTPKEAPKEASKTTSKEAPKTVKSVAKVEVVNQENDADDEEEETSREHNTKKLEYYNIKFKEYQAKLTAISDKIEYYKSLLE